MSVCVEVKDTVKDDTSSTDTATSEQCPLVKIDTDQQNKNEDEKLLQTVDDQPVSIEGPSFQAVVQSPMEETSSPPSVAQFHIPSSNMSEAGYSECSLTSEHFLNCRRALTKSESLSARQQVALWLTKTSMTDLSSVPSLRSLVQSNSLSGPADKSPQAPFKKIIQRNYSAKSLIGSLTFGFGKSEKSSKEKIDTGEEEKIMHSPIRKCETALVLSGAKTPSCCPSRAPTPSTMPAAGSCCGGSVVYPCCSSSSQRNSNFDLFARLSHENRTGSRRLPVSHTHSTPSGALTPHARSVVSEAPFAGSGCESPFPGIRPYNRLRYTSSLMCSGCTSVLSVNVSRMTSRMTSRAPSQMSLAHGGTTRRHSANVATVTEEHDLLCKICLLEYLSRDMAKLQACGCYFCKECMCQYVTFEVMSGSYDISCPDPDCEHQGVLKMNEVEVLAGKEVVEKHRKFRLNTEVDLDKERAWCPQAGCETICHICSASSSSGPVDVKCPSCQKEFCSLCSATWHPGLSCEENGKALVKRAGTSVSLSGMYGPGNGENSLLIDGIEIKRCPMCHVPIERDAGCAQMMCKRCKHAFCWYCLESLDGDFLLRHYDRGACKGQLGHSRYAVLWHRVQVIGMCALFGLVVIVASPFLLAIAPCIFCCGYRSCKGSTGSIDDPKTSKVSKSNTHLNATNE